MNESERLFSLLKAKDYIPSPLSRPLSGRDRVFLGFGSNVGRRERHLQRALRLVAKEPGIRLVRASFLYKTTPVGYTAQRDFLNGVVEIRTNLAPSALLQRLQALERTMGKEVPFPGGPRKIDIDLLLYGGETVKAKTLVVPHPALHRRMFVLVPLRQIAPRAVHPLFGKTAARLLRECQSPERVEVWGPWQQGDPPGTAPQSPR